MYIATKTIITNVGQVELRVKALDWLGKRYGLYANGEMIYSGNYENVMNWYDNNRLY